MARAALPHEMGIDLNSPNREKADELAEKHLNKDSSPAAGIVFGLLCSLIAWLFLAYGIYRIHAMSVAVR
jgi:hypothetical protein